MRKKAERLISGNLVIAAVAVLAFSRAGLNLSFGGSAAGQAAALTVAILCVAAFFYVNCRILFSKEPVYSPEDQALDAQAAELGRLASSLPFAREDIQRILDITGRFRAKEKALFRAAALGGNKRMNFLMITNRDAKAAFTALGGQALRRLVILDASDGPRYGQTGSPALREITGRLQALLDRYNVFLEEVSRMGSHVDIHDERLLDSIEVLRLLRAETDISFADEPSSYSDYENREDGK